jgi:hypothetical protein
VGGPDGLAVSVVVGHRVVQQPAAGEAARVLEVGFVESVHGVTFRSSDTAGVVHHRESHASATPGALRSGGPFSSASSRRPVAPRWERPATSMPRSAPGVLSKTRSGADHALNRSTRTPSTTEATTPASVAVGLRDQRPARAPHLPLRGWWDPCGRARRGRGLGGGRRHCRAVSHPRRRALAQRHGMGAGAPSSLRVTPSRRGGSSGRLAPTSWPPAGRPWWPAGARLAAVAALAVHPLGFADRGSSGCSVGRRRRAHTPWMRTARTRARPRDAGSWLPARRSRTVRRATRPPTPRRSTSRPPCARARRAGSPPHEVHRAPGRHVRIGRFVGAHAEGAHGPRAAPGVGRRAHQRLPRVEPLVHEELHRLRAELAHRPTVSDDGRVDDAARDAPLRDVVVVVEEQHGLHVKVPARQAPSHPRRGQGPRPGDAYGAR